MEKRKTQKGNKKPRELPEQLWKKREAGAKPGIITWEPRGRKRF